MRLNILNCMIFIFLVLKIAGTEPLKNRKMKIKNVYVNLKKIICGSMSQSFFDSCLIFILVLYY